MPAEIISLLSSPCLGPSPAQPAPAQPRPEPAVVGRALTYSDDVFDLTADSPEPLLESTERPVPENGQKTLTYSPRVVSGTKRAREDHATFEAPVFFMSDDFDTTIDLDSSLPANSGPDLEPRHVKKPRLSPTTHAGCGSLSSAQSDPITAYQPSRAPLRQPTAALRRAQVSDDPIEFSSSPGLPPRPTVASTTAKMSQSVESDDPFASSPPSAQHTLSNHRQNCSTTDTKSVEESVSRLGYDLTSYADDPFASSPRPPSKPASKPGAISLDDDDDDADEDDPFAASTTSMPTEAPTRQFTSLGKGKQKAAVSPTRRANWDPISSSAPDPQLPSDPFSPPPPRGTFTKSVSEVIDLSDADSEPTGLSIGSDDDFPDLDSFDTTRLKRRVEGKNSSYRASSVTTKPTISRNTTKKSADDRARDKEARTRYKEARATDREREKERKRQEKEAARVQKARDKERSAALAEVNKIRTDKKVSTPEMIADLPSSLSAAFTLQIQTLLKDLDVEHAIWDSPVENVVKWRRKVASCFNDELGHWEPMPMSIEADKFALFIVNASQFVAYALGAGGNDLESHVLMMKRHFPTEQLIYLIEGLTPWMRKNRNVRSRQFASAVRNQSAAAASDSVEPSTTTAPSRRRKTQQQQQQPHEYINEDSIEDALLELQVMHNVLIHHTNVAVETAQWVAIFTQHISTVPYRKQREAVNVAGAGFCMETGQVRTGDDVKDTYVRMLQEIVRVTAPTAYGIAAEFDTVPKLVKGLEEGGPLALENLRKSTNKNGGFSDRAVGKSVSKRVHKVFTGRDEWSTAV